MPALLLASLLACVVAPDDTAASSRDSVGDSGSDTVADPATVPLAGACDLADDFGGFAVTALDDESAVEGAVADSVVPADVLVEVAAEGGCRMLRRDNPFCDPACDPGEACTFENTCVAWPANQDLGTVTIDGLLEPVSMEPVFPGNLYYDTELPHPALLPGELVTLSMPGGVYGPIELYGVGVEPLDATGLAWTLGAGTDLDLTWPAPGGPVVRSEIVVSLSIDQHGVSPSRLECALDDDGAAAVPATLIDALLNAGVTGFPAATITRRTADRAPAGAGCLDFEVASPRVVPVTVEGHTPCVTDNECPDGQTCDEEMQTCE